MSNLNNEVTGKENELMILKESLGEDSPLVELADVQAQLLSARNEVQALEAQVQSLQLLNTTLNREWTFGNFSYIIQC